MQQEESGRDKNQLKKRTTKLNIKIKKNLELMYRRRLVYTKKNIFNSPNKYPIVHCISRCKKMSAWFAKTLCNEYPDLRKMDYDKVGTCHRFKTKSGRVILNLITKNVFYEKPSIKNIKSSLNSLKETIIRHNYHAICMPKICSGKDRHDWLEIENIIKDVFWKSCGLKIFIYYL